MYNFQPKKKSKNLGASLNLKKSQQSLESNKVECNIQKINKNTNNNNSLNQNINRSSKAKIYTNSKDVNNIKHRNENKSDIQKTENYSFDPKSKNNKINIKKNANLTGKNNPVIIEIEYEKIGNNKAVSFDENGNFNVYFMKPVLKSKTITTSNMNNKKNQSINNMINDDNDDNPYKYDDDNMNGYPQFQNKNSDVMPLEIVHKKNEKKFKAHLVQRLKSFKLKQAEKNKIPLNIASKKRREETFRESLKHLLARQAQPFDIKKELMYYKGYFRFWKRKCKNFYEPKKKKI